MRQGFGKAELLRDESPIRLESLESSNEIGQDISTAVHEPVELISMRRRVNTGAAAVLNPINKFLERHFVLHL